MSKIMRLLRKPFATRYRLTVIVQGHTMNTYGIDKHLLLKMAKNTLDMEYWTLYKSGPFGMRERKVAFGKRVEC